MATLPTACCTPAHGARRGFTLIELLVVLAVVSLLVAMLLPALARSKLAAQRALCSSNLRQLSLGHLMYADAHDGWFPGTHWTTQAGIGFDSGKDPANWYGNEKIFECPDTRFMGSLPQYGPGRFPGASAGGFKFRWASYRIVAARGSRNSPPEDWTFFGIHQSSGIGTRNDNRISPGIPNLNMAGRIVTDPKTGYTKDPRTHYLHEPSMMPLALDGRKFNDVKYYHYTDGYNSFSTNNHARLGGYNIVFLDGHLRWGDPATGENRVSFYGSGGYYKW